MELTTATSAFMGFFVGLHRLKSKFFVGTLALYRAPLAACQSVSCRRIQPLQPLCDLARVHPGKLAAKTEPKEAGE